MAPRRAIYSPRVPEAKSKVKALPGLHVPQNILGEDSPLPLPASASPGVSWSYTLLFHFK